MKARLDALASDHAPLQAWHAEATWIPVFDRAEDYEDTVYKDMRVHTQLAMERPRSATETATPMEALEIIRRMAVATVMTRLPLC